MVKKLEHVEMMDCLQLLHFHVGSQIPFTTLFADGVGEATQIYSELDQLGAHMCVIDIGGSFTVKGDLYAQELLDVMLKRNAAWIVEQIPIKVFCVCIVGRKVLLLMLSESHREEKVLAEMVQIRLVETTMDVLHKAECSITRLLVMFLVNFTQLDVDIASLLQTGDDKECGGDVRPDEVEHYGCLLDPIGRAGRLGEVMEIVKGMSMEPDEVVWGSLLNGCKVYGRTDLAEFAAKKLVEIDPHNGGYKIMLANIYGELGKWNEVRNVWRVLKQQKSYKVPGCSWIEVDDQVHQFYSLDQSNPKTEELYSVLESFVGFRNEVMVEL